MSIAGSQPLSLPPHRRLREPELVFHPERPEDRHVHPLKGLVSLGPYSRSLVSRVLDPIRAAVIAPPGGMRQVERLCAELERQHRPLERRHYLIEFPGFSRLFGIRVVLASEGARMELSSELDNELAGASRPHVVLAERITQAISSLEARRHEFDVLLILLPEKWEGCFYGGTDEDFDLHDYLKAVTAVRGIPTQVILESSALRYGCRASVMWRLGIALYCKAGGIPWKLAHTDPETAYIGLSYAVRQASQRRPRFVTCCSQVFDADGAGLEFILYDTDDVRFEQGNPFLSQGEMRRVMARSLQLYQRRHAGRAPRRVVVHKSTEFQPQEVDGCSEAWSSSHAVDLIQVQQDVAWRGIHIEAPPHGGTKGKPGNYPCERGSYVQLGGREILLWTQGNAPAAVVGKNFYKEGKGIPSPLLLVRFAGHGAWDDACRAVLGLTKMNWNNDGLYDRLPVTLSYAHTLARTAKRMPELAAGAYSFRFFM